MSTGQGDTGQQKVPGPPSSQPGSQTFVSRRFATGHLYPFAALDSALLLTRGCHALRRRCAAVTAVDASSTWDARSPLLFLYPHNPPPRPSSAAVTVTEASSIHRVHCQKKEYTYARFLGCLSSQYSSQYSSSIPSIYAQSLSAPPAPTPLVLIPSPPPPLTSPPTPLPHTP